ncbi:MAG TPA: ThuA domain-containing protein [Tepidisphaeraceae bacterium]|nr:ThuA domain-containing protein [Tepidisphaeraceae bacterium]
MKLLIFLLTLIVCTPMSSAQFRQTAILHPIRVVVWDEQQPQQKPAYDNFLGNAIADYLKELNGFKVTSVKMDDKDQGLPDELLNDTDILIWWGHLRHKDVKDELAKKIVDRVKSGKLALISLHSAHWSKPFVLAMNERATQDALSEIIPEKRAELNITYVTPKPYTVPKRTDPLTPSSKLNGSNLIITLPACVFPAYRADGKPSHVRTLIPGHVIAHGLPQSFDIPQTEMYDEPFHVPTPDTVIFEEKWDSGEHFRSACLWKVGQGLVFYFRPGHETYPVYKQKLPLKILENACTFLRDQLPPAR